MIKLISWIAFIVFALDAWWTKHNLENDDLDLMGKIYRPLTYTMVLAFLFIIIRLFVYEVMDKSLKGGLIIIATVAIVCIWAFHTFAMLIGAAAYYIPEEFEDEEDDV